MEVTLHSGKKITLQHLVMPIMVEVWDREHISLLPAIKYMLYTWIHVIHIFRAVMY
jgi:hypothetical protein